ncbi:extracellular solute-binding protein [Kutzneria sp. 744]|uniref:extracellular solute-binding protein n=1 Tax=Kutzneria sp. (strain 744) TaxID=345341 RepID=UPI0003EEB29A|nr:extracellular solute-binding protein [Kutzneria sp. 744]EWM17134.1 multiple sugar transporter substrate-binding protein [Kutzneria sp. 744]
MRSIRLCAAVVAALLVAACGSSGTTGSGALTWWHNGTSDPLKSLWQSVADGYHAAHPDVTVTVDPIQNEQFQTKVPLALQSDSPPGAYQQWGGGQLTSQIKSGKVLDLTSAVSGWIGKLGKAAEGWQSGGKQYGVPYDRHVVGFWYRKDLFAKADITTPPATMADFDAAIDKLRAAGVTPVAIGSKDRWPDAFYWDYFAVRECSTNVVKQSIEAQKLDDPCWRKAGDDLTALLAKKPFQEGFLGTPAQQGAGSSAGMVANGQAAMELQGDWEPGTMAALTEDKDFASKLGWFPFPSVDGGAGDPGVTLGGGDGFSCTTAAPPACPDFLKYISSTEVQSKLAAAGIGLPVNPDAASALKDATLRQVFDFSQKATYIQTYFDVALPTAVGQALDDAIANFVAGKGTSASVAQSVGQAATGDR